MAAKILAEGPVEKERKNKKGKRSKSSESVKKMALQSIYMQCREAEQKNGSLGTRCKKIETGSDTHQ